MAYSMRRPKGRSTLNVGRLRQHHQPLWSTDDDRRSIEAFLRDVDRIQQLSHAEQRELVRLAQQGDDRARQKLLTSNVRLLIVAAHDFAGLGLPTLELVSEGMIGMDRALTKFDLRRPVHFTTYAIWWIKQMMLRALMNNKQIVRLPVNVQQKLRQLSRLENELLVKNGLVTHDELQEYGRVNDELFRLWRTHNQQTVSLDQPVGDGEKHTLADILVSPEDVRIGSEPWERVMDECGRIIDLFRLRWNTMRHLSVRDRRVIVKRFGLDGHPTCDNATVGSAFGFTRERARQIETFALRRLYPKHTLLEARRELGRVHNAIITYLHFVPTTDRLDWTS